MKCLILSQGPVPAPEHTKVEGGGLRCWGLAKGLKTNNHDLQVTVAYNESYRQENFTQEYEDIKLTTWNLQTLPSLLSDYDSIIVSYCMGELSIVVADNIRPDQQLILDCYVPIYVEVSARDSNDIESEYAAFHEDVSRWAHVLRKGDIFLCASAPQKRYYLGVLSGLGRINPVTYGEDIIKIVPYGIYRDEPKATTKPISNLISKKPPETRKILWFGGIYPWFDLRTLVDAVVDINQKLPAELIIVGAKNPFNSHPDFVRKYKELVEHVNANQERKAHVTFQDWVQFNKRADWYLDSDLVVVINKLGDENELAWRTRLVDFVWADLPIITNGGDPLGETLISNQAALRFSDLTAKAISQNLVAALRDQKAIQLLKANIKKIRSNYYWDVVTQELAKVISSQSKAADLAKYGHYEIADLTPKSKVEKLRSAAGKAKMIPAYTQKYGARNTYYAIRTKVKNRLRKKLGTGRKQPGIVMVAHQLDFSGAPYVFMDLAQALVDSKTELTIEFHTFNPAPSANLTRLNRMGLKPNIHISKDIELQYLNGDTVVLNTVAHSQILKNSIYTGLETGRLKKLIWFIHEDEPELIFRNKERTRLSKLLKGDKLIMFIAAEQTLKNYQAAFRNTTNIRKQPYKYSIPEQYQQVRQESDFDKLSFIMPGTIDDGRKGQLPIFYAFADFHKRYYQKTPKDYRDFELVVVGMTDHFLSRQLLKHENLLKGHFKHYGRVKHSESLELVTASNITICYSLRECLPLFVFEGMATGHPILRNDSSGMEEQLIPEKNGFYIDSADFNQVVETIERITNKSKTTNKQLVEMSKEANKIALKQAEFSYDPMVKAIIADSFIESQKNEIISQ